MSRLFHSRGFFTTALAVVSLLDGAVLASRAAAVVVPNGLEAREGTGSSGIFDQAGREQTVYAATNFPAGPISIYELRYRPNVTDYMPGNAFSATNLGLRIVLSTSSVQPGGLSPIFSDNTGSNAEAVVSGAVTLSSLFIGPDAGPKVFDIVISLDSPFTYDPAQGNLLVDIQNFSDGPTSPVDAEYSTNGAASRVVSRSPFSPAGVRDDDADVLQIGYSQSGGTNPPTGPIIVSQPTNEIVPIGRTTVFSVVARGAAPLSYQWIFDGTNILAGATNSSLVLTNVQVNEAGTYGVRVSNAAGGTNSVAATLTVARVVIPGYICAVLRGDCADAPPPPHQVGAIATGSNYVIMTVAYGDPGNWPAAQQLATDAAFQSIMPQYCALPKTGCVTDSVQWNIITYNADGTPNTSGCAASGCQDHSCDAVPGYLCAVLRSGCTDAPPPPQQVGAIATGPGYVILTVAYGDPNNWPAAQQIVTDAAFESIMPQYCALPKTGCVTDAVQWNIITYNANGSPNTSGCAASGCQDRSCTGFESGPPVIVGQPANQSVNSGQSATFSVNASGVAPLSYQWIFDGTNVLAGATNAVLVLPHAQTNQAGTYLVEISNSLGATNSLPATLTVNPGPAATNGYITAVLRSGCTSSPTPPPPVGGTRVGPDYVIMTVADASPTNVPYAQQVVTDAIFESLMPLYCVLPGNSGVGCVTKQVQWNIITYDTNGNPVVSACAASGCQYHSCAGGSSVPGYLCAVLRSGCTDSPPPPTQVGAIASGPGYVIMTVAYGDPGNWPAAQQIVTDAAFESIMPQYCALPKVGCVTDAVQWNIITYNADGSPHSSGCSASGCQDHLCADVTGPPMIVGQPTNQVVSAGRSATFSVDATGAAPLNYQWIFDGTNVLAGATNRSLLLTNVQANEAGTYGVLVANAAGSTNSVAAKLTVTPFVIPGYICAVLRGDCADAPPPPPQVGGIVTGSNYVILTVAYGDPRNWPAAQQIATDAAFASIMPLYCALPKTGCVRDGVQWNIITYNTNGTPNTSGCAASGCQDHSCAEVGTGYICAVLRSDCTSAPIPPPPVGATNIGPDYVIMTVAAANPMNFLYARQIVTDAIFESLMPLYCGLPGNSGVGCVTNRVQWNIVTYDTNGNPAISGCAASGCDYHYCGGGGPRLRSPMLSITPSTNGIGLAWPSSTSDFILEASSNLVNWYAVNPVVQTNGGRVSAQVPAPTPAPGLFYRLRQK